MFKRLTKLIFIFSFLLPSPAFPGGRKTELYISAAISLKDTLAVIQQNYEADNSGIKIYCSFGSSGTLQTQIEQGAPADLFIPAAEKQMDFFERKGLILKKTRRNLVENRLVLVVPKDSPLQLKGFEDLKSEKIKYIGIGAPDSVPAGEYACQLLKNLGIWEEIKNKAVFGNNARAVLAYVETSNVDAGIVYRTDALLSSTVKIVTVAKSDFHQPIIYPVAITANTKHRKEAQRLLSYLISSEGRAVFQKYGFIVPN
ncbi:MAG: molybdate ABC transporter substrate-binding protein [Bacillota bacterium]